MKKKLVALFMVSAMTAGLLSGCGSAQETAKDTEKAEASSEAVEETQTQTDAAEAEFDPRTITEGVTLTIAVEAKSVVIDWDTNLVTQKLEDRFGVDLQFEVYPAGEFADKLNVMINGGDKLPDIIFGGDGNGLKNQETAWVDSGAILELTKYYEDAEYADYPKYANIAMEWEGVDFVSTLKDAEGKIWGVPTYTVTSNSSAGPRLWINENYAKAVGFDELPTTTEGFFELCKAFAAAGDVNGNGLDDEVVFTSNGIAQNWFKFLMSPYAYAWDDYCLDVEDGTLSFAFATEGWKEGLKYIKQFFDEGLIDSTIITQDYSAYTAIASNPEAVVLADFWFKPQMVNEDIYEQNKTLLEYGYVAALEGPSGRVEGFWLDKTAVPGAMITVDCENPDAAFLVLDYMLSQEMAACNRYGEEGVDWDYWDNVDDSKFTDGTTKDMYRGESGGDPVFVSYTNSTYWYSGNPQNSGYMMAGPFVQFYNSEGRVMAGGKTEADQTAIEWTKRYLSDSINAVRAVRPKETIATLPMTIDEKEAVSEPMTVIGSFYWQAAANFLTGVWDIDEDWDSYLEELEKMGISDVLAVYQTAYDRTK